MPKISDTTLDVITWTKLVLHSHFMSGHLQKEKYLEVMGTSVGCLPRALRYLSVPRGLGCSGDPVGLNFECSWQVDMLQVYRHRGGHRVSLTMLRRPALGVKAGARTGRHNADSKGPRARAEYNSGPRSVAWSGVAGPESDQLVVCEGEEQYTGGGGRSIRFLGKG
ncbi:hypothetical protein TIFTF001_010867 [Ficus carica]|uniref:Uncharacterized protein n=1 Tax=Ficus carica TaxID=3494 RepID=A0AA88D4U3_FICCA|nr:hypothetical protein TIFTF001_010867 [Ficus carica]